MVEIYKCGTKVNIIDAELDVIIDSVCIDKSNIRYKCIWWDGKTRKEDWVSESEIEPAKKSRQKIGFK